MLTLFARGFFLIKKKKSIHIIDGCRCTHRNVQPIRDRRTSISEFSSARTSVNIVIVPTGTSLVRSDNRIEKINKNYNVTAGTQRALVENKCSRFCIHFRTWDGRCAFFSPTSLYKECLGRL